MNKIAVSPKVCRDMLDVGQTKLYALINGRELEIFKLGRATRITVSSIEAYVARQLAANNGSQAPKAG